MEKIYLGTYSRNTGFVYLVLKGVLNKMADTHLKTAMVSRVERFRKSAAERYSLDEKDIHIGHLALEGFYDDPDMVCQIDSATGQEETNRSVAIRSCQLASAMSLAGLKPGDTAIIMDNNHLDLCIPYFACHYEGYPICAIDPIIGPSDLEKVFPYLLPKIIFCQKASEEKVYNALKANCQKAKVVVFDDKESDLEAFVRKYNGTKNNYRPALFDQSKISAWYLMTSGTTGLPKVAVIPYDTLLNAILSWWEPFPYSFDTIFTTSTLQWLSALLYFMSGPLKGSTRIQSSAPLTPTAFVEIINKYRPFTAAFTPFLLSHFLDVAEKTCDLTCFKYILVAGGATDKSLADRFKKKSDAFLYTVYGMSELLVPVFDFNKDTPFGSSGKSLSRYEYKLVGDDGEKLEGAHKTGELWIKGDAFFKGYLNNPEETKTMLTDDGWFMTGDMFYKDEQEHYYFVERKRLLIKHYAFMLSPLQMEGLIKQLPYVMDACIVGLPHADCMEMPIIALVRRNSDNIDPKEVFDLLRKSLEGKQLTAGLFFVDSLPVTPSGKVHRAKVKEMALAAKKAEKILF